jgi:hypothetical protein
MAREIQIRAKISPSPANWTDSPSGGTNYATIAITDQVKFYRLRNP